MRGEETSAIEKAKISFLRHTVADNRFNTFKMLTCPYLDCNKTEPNWALLKRHLNIDKHSLTLSYAQCWYCGYGAVTDARQFINHMSQHNKNQRHAVLFPKYGVNIPAASVGNPANHDDNVVNPRTQNVSINSNMNVIVL